MKLVLLLLVLVTFAAIGAFATSPVKCDSSKCDAAACKKPDCKCGTHKDACDCCEVCYKCPGEQCVPLFQDKCSGSNHCELEAGAAIITGARGICTAKKALFDTEHHG
ncbi:unnamed protein product [Ixodes persulcatus]